MKKLFTILTVVALTTTVSFAQAQFGATAGLNMANITGGDVDDEWVMKMGMNFGLSANITLSDNMTLNTGALYSTKGSQMEESGVEVAINLSYIEIPLNLSFPCFKYIKISASLPISLSIFLIIFFIVSLFTCGIFDAICICSLFCSFINVQSLVNISVFVIIP